MPIKKRETSEPEIYREVIVFALGRAVIALFIVLTIFFLGMFISDLVSGPVGDKPASEWFYLAMCLFFVLMTFVIANFSKLVIKATSRSITVAYGLFKCVIPWEDIADCYPDESTALLYGGYGIRMSRVNGKSRLVYNVLGGERVALGLKKDRFMYNVFDGESVKKVKFRFSEFVFSTNDPDAVMDVVKGRIGK